jgi:hypothetical protein
VAKSWFKMITPDVIRKISPQRVDPRAEDLTAPGAISSHHQTILADPGAVDIYAAAQKVGP